MTETDRKKQALRLKDEGNALFKSNSYKEAIEKYTEAIQQDPGISILYSNRSRCYRQLEDFENSYIDAQKAVELDDKNIKAYFLMGETLVELAFNSKDKVKIQMAIEKIKKSLRLCPSQGKEEFEDRFVEEIYRAKKKLWHITVEEKQEEKKLLRSYLINIVQTDMNISEEEKDALNENITSLMEQNYGRRDQVPRALVCHITKAILKDPVCNEYGNSYSKKAYREELKRNGNLDPLSSKPIKTNIMYPNINLKKAIEHFLERNPWAYDEPTQ